MVKETKAKRIDALDVYAKCLVSSTMKKMFVTKMDLARKVKKTANNITVYLSPTIPGFPCGKALAKELNIYDECFSEERYQEEIPLGKALFKLGRTRTIALLDKIPEDKVETFFEISEKIINDRITTEADNGTITITRLKFLDLMSRNQLDPKATYKILPLED